ncbi:MAG TPA: NUDIX hydrolase [Oculatellaceae cyanobacterium]
MSKQRFKRRPGQTIPTTRVSVVVLDSDEKKILLVRHRKGSRQYWVLPGGRLEYGETFHECAIRELKEETGLDVAIERFLFISEAIAPDRARHIVNIFVQATVTGGVLKVGNEPVLAGVEFIDLSELERMTLFPPVGQMILDSLPNGFSDTIKYLGNLWV